MPDLRDVCESFISKIELNVFNLPHWLALSVEHNIWSAQDRCYAFAAANQNFEGIRLWVPALKTSYHNIS